MKYALANNIYKNLPYLKINRKYLKLMPVAPFIK